MSDIIAENHLRIIRFLCLKNLEVSVVNVFKDECRCSGHRVLDHIQQSDDVSAAPQVLENFYFPLDFLLFDWLKSKQCLKICLCVKP